MIGASLSGVTFISVPGWVGTSQFSYMQMVLGYLAGYIVIATVLMPMYYRLNLISIYTYLEERFGFWSYKTGAFFFLLSRTIGAAFRLYLVAGVLQIAVFDAWNVPFAATVIITVLLIWLYTYKGGIKTIIRTDILQTLFMLIAVGVSMWLIADDLNLGLDDLVKSIKESQYSRVFFFDDWNDKRHFVKQFFAGAFIAIVMTGLDQDMMQKNLSCRNIKDAQKNMFWFSIVLVFVNLFFLSLGALLYIFVNTKGIDIPVKTDDLYPIIATRGYLSPVVGVFFILGLIAAAYSSADSALTALTTSFCVDFLGIGKRSDNSSPALPEPSLPAGREEGESAHKQSPDLRERFGSETSIRKKVHLIVSVLLIGVILIFNAVNDKSVISAIFTVAGYTYGPLLGMYAFGLFCKFKVRDKLVPVVCLLSPVACYILNVYSEVWFNGFEFGFEMLVINGALTFAGLFIIKNERLKT